MSGSGTDPEWTVEDARNARRQVDARQGRIGRILSPLVGRGLGLKNRVVAGLIGGKAYDASLSRVAQHMNRNHDAFSDYAPQQGDVVVAAYFKAGTNWIMHVCHQICQLGAAEFDHIQDVIPWPDAAEPRFWVNVHDDRVRQTPTGLRVIKSHLPAGKIPINDPARYIAVTRDPKDCAASGYHFFRTLVFGTTMPPPDVWLAHFRSQQPNFGRWDVFTASWYHERARPNVLFLTFEDIKRDNLGAIQQIADFMDVTLTHDQLARVAKATSIEAMKAINHKFYPARQSRFTNAKGKIIRKGGIGDAANLFRADDLRQFDIHWRDALAASESEFPYTALYASDRQRSETT